MKKMEKTVINGVVRTEKIRLSQIATILETGEMPEEVYVSDLIAYVYHKLELLDNKSSSDKKAAEKSAVREKIRTAVLAVLESEPERWFTVSEIMVSDTKNLGTNYSNSAVTSMLTNLKKEGIVINERVKGKSLYAICKPE